MQSFRTELENPLVEKDIIDLERKIRLYREGKIDDDKFRSLRLARGVYGQRQQGVQMVRIKLPYGKMTLKQWKRIADISDEFATGNLHLTTRQDVQIHFVSLDRTPELWAKLELDNITLREACGNTVRNITASDTAGIDPQEPFDITPYCHAVFEYFLRNPICQEMGRKIKMSFSNSDADTSLAYIHDFGFIPKINAQNERGFKVLVGGGLGAQPKMAELAFDFLPENQLIPFIEAGLRVFDRHGERISRSKARLKFLVQKIGFDTFMQLIEDERIAIKSKVYEIKTEGFEIDTNTLENKIASIADLSFTETEHYKNWKATNVIAQKQEGYFAAYIRVPLGNISSTVSRALIEKLRGYVADDVRVTINQGLQLRYIKEENLPYIYSTLNDYLLASAGANSALNITACPGTDTCNLAISDSTQVTLEFEKVLQEEFANLIYDNRIKIKISGCMNSCGQHGMANIGFHGSSLKAADKRVLPALQVLLGGGTIGDGVGRAAEKVIKVPSKRGPEVLRFIFSDYEQNAIEGEYFNDYYDRKGKNYFYDLLKPLADLSHLANTDFIDWGHDETFATAIGVGECAGVMIDLVATLLYESEEKLANAKEAFLDKKYSDAIYYAYATQVNTAKALLLGKEVNCSTQHGVIAEFDKNFADEFGGNFKEQVMQINQNEPSQEFASTYIMIAEKVLQDATALRETNLMDN